jgi:YVTN family beta-propeller protein
MLRKSPILLLVAAAAFAVEPEHEVYIVNRKPASIAIVNTATWETGASIKLPGKPGQALLAPEGRFAYFLVSGMVDPLKPPKKPAELMIVDMAERKILKSVPLGPRVARISLSPDGRFVIALSLGPPVKGRSVDPALTDARKGRVHTGATLTLVDRSSGHSATVLPVGSPASSVQGTRDGSRLFVLATPDGVTLLRELGDDKRLSQLRSSSQRAKSTLSIYRPGQETPDRTVELDCWPASWAITPDGKWVYFLDPGVPSANAHRYQEGELVVVDADAGKVAAVHKAGARPDHLSFDDPTGEITALSWASAEKGETKTQLLRFRGADALPSFDAEDARFIARVPGVPGRWLVTGTAICAWPDGASPGTCIPVTYKRAEWDDQGHAISSSGTRVPANGKNSSGESQNEDQKEAASGPSLNGVPDELLPVRGGEALAVKAVDRLGIVDLKTNRLERAITTGRGAVKAGKVLGTVVASVAALAMIGSVEFAILAPRLYSAANYGMLAPAGMLVGPEGDTVYAVNTFSDDVTILDANTGKAVAKIPVGGGCLGIGLTPNGRFVVAHSPNQITVIDTRTHSRALERQLTDETVNAVYTLRQTPRIVALATHFLVVVDAESGEMVYTPEKFGDPIQLLEPGQP